jgi:hypothetical protein
VTNEGRFEQTLTESSAPALVDGVCFALEGSLEANIMGREMQARQVPR